MIMLQESQKNLVCVLALLNGKDFANPKSFGGCPAGVPGYLKLFEWSLIEHIFLSFLLSSSSPPPRIYSSKYYSPFLLFFFISSKRNLFIIILLFFSTTFAPHFPSNYLYLFFLLRYSSALQTIKCMDQIAELCRPFCLVYAICCKMYDVLIYALYP